MVATIFPSSAADGCDILQWFSIPHDRRRVTRRKIGHRWASVTNPSERQKKRSWFATQSAAPTDIGYGAELGAPTEDVTDGGGITDGRADTSLWSLTHYRSK